MTQSRHFKVPSHVKISIHIICNQIFLVSSTPLGNRYIKVPNSTTVSKSEHRVLFQSKELAELPFIKFIDSVRVWLRLSERPFKKKIFLKGLGYKANLLENKNGLNLKIGLSHLVKISIPSDKISLKINKKMITIRGCSATDVGNFAERIRKLRVPDSYKGKGIWYKNENRILKILKKK
jgi:ribosomal protein L6P/L9E